MAAAESEAAGAGRAEPSWEPWVGQLLFSPGLVLDILTRVSESVCDLRRQGG